MLAICKNCNEEKEHHGKGLCYRCYRRILWKPKDIICKRCGKERPLHAKDLCGGCYSTIFRSDHNKEWNYRKWHGLDKETYNKITKACTICGFDKVVDLHHLDEDHKNNSHDNLIGLCPNHHKMLHNFSYRREMLNNLKEKGFNPPKDPKLDFKR